MAASLYKNYMRICNQWRVDPSKKGRDLGEFIRHQILKEFSKGEASNIRDIKDCERKMQCLSRLVNNHYGKQYKRSTYATASGLTLEQCQEVLSNKSLEELKEKEFGLLERIRFKLQKQFT